MAGTLACWLLVTDYCLQPLRRCFLWAGWQRRGITTPRLGVTDLCMTDPRIKSAVARLGLSVRESQIVVCLAEGKTTRQVVKSMGISNNTVRTHVGKVFTKLEINSRVELVSLVLLNVLEGVDSVGPPGTGSPAVESKVTLDAQPHAVPSG